LLFESELPVIRNLGVARKYKELDEKLELHEYIDHGDYL